MASAAATAGGLLALVLLGPLVPGTASAQGAPARLLITAPVTGAQRQTLRGNTRPEANPSNDRGRVPDALPLEHIQLLLRRPAEREMALRQYLEQLHDRRSPNFHRWLSAVQLGQQYGLAPQDVAAITGWLRQQGFTVNGVYRSTLLIDFSGTAGAVRNAFHTEIHSLDVRGARHIANMSDPQIPAALVPAVVGIVAMHDFRPHPLHVPRVQRRAPARTQYTTSTGYYALVPADLWTIYNFSPLFSQGLSGQGQTIVVIEDTDVYSTGDWTTFRNTLGLSGYTHGSFTQIHPSGANNCPDPGANGDQDEAILDAEWASAGAPDAAIVLASCTDTATFGGLLALENLVNGPSPPAIVSISYGECEAGNGAAGNAAYASIYQQAVTEGVSVFASAGDEGAASCDADQPYATHGIGVSGLASTPYNVAVGGTDFADAYLGTTGTYWSQTNGADYGSALSYVPEIPWNNSCASTLIASVERYATTYGSSGFCNNAPGDVVPTPKQAGFLTTASGSGGPSGCATGTTSPPGSGIVSGTCAGTPKPSWQQSATPADGVRDLPDVSLFAANGVWGHYYVFCWSNTAATGGAPCTGTPDTWSGGGGTSFSAPILAAIQALVNQKAGGPQGNPNPVYYALAASQAASGKSCNSTSSPASGCVFYDVTLGDMDVGCRTTNNCYLPSATNGVLSTSDGSYAKAYGAATGWDFATGLGTVNAYNLVTFSGSSDLSISGRGSVTSLGLLSSSLTVSNAGPQTATGVAVAATLAAGLLLVAGDSSPGCTQSGQTVTCTVANLAANATASVTIVIQPPGPEQVNLTFSVRSGNGDLNPNNNSVTIAIDDTSSAASDGPVPLWADVALGLVLLVLAMRPLAPAVPRHSRVRHR